MRVTYTSRTPQIVKRFDLTFQGYWTTSGGTPTGAGIYCVYAGTHDQKANTVNPRALIYVGQSQGVRDRIAEHLGDETGRAWERQLKPGEILIYSYAPITAERERTEAAIIYKHKPPTNTQCVDNFPYSPTRVVSAGTTALLNTDFTVG